MSSDSKLDSEYLEAVRKGEITRVRRLLKNGVETDVQDPSDGSTALLIATREAKGTMTELLLNYGANVNAENRHGLRPLHCAVMEGHEEISRLLLRYWADPNATDDLGQTPLHLAANYGRHRILKLLLENHANPSLKNRDGSFPNDIALDNQAREILSGNVTHVPPREESKRRPMFPIVINGNQLDLETPAGDDASWTNYILIQTEGRLSPQQRKILSEAGVEVKDYVSNNTYLCGYYESNLGHIREMDFIVYVDVYRKELKVSSGLQNLQTNSDIEVNVTFQDTADLKDKSLQNLVAMKAGKKLKEIKFSESNALIAVPVSRMQNLASIDEVRDIEEAGEQVLQNTVASQILYRGPSLGPGLHPPVHYGYQGEGQTIAIADTGLDTGQRFLGLNFFLHHAFGNRVKAWYSTHGPSRDTHGHGTHVCASAVGQGRTIHGNIIIGTAPEAHLVVQSIWLRSGGINAPKDLADLFNPPYNDHQVRVHSNSWLTKFADGRLPGYTPGARQIDKFVWEHKDMVFCWCAGNDGRNINLTTEDFQEDQIGAEAAAKNCITVGAAESYRPDFPATYQSIPGSDLKWAPSIRARRIALGRENIAAFSSRGPTRADHQGLEHIKPDVVAPGTAILSANSSARASGPPPPLLDDSRWCYRNGTSMATPLVAGCVATLREALIKTRPAALPSAALIKALVINGAEIICTSMPSSDSGFGLVNIAKSVSIACGTDDSGFREDEVSHTIKGTSITIVVPSPNTTLKATLVWSDPPGKAIKNSLRLGIEAGAAIKHPRPVSNNVQQIIWKNITPGFITITVQTLGDLDMSPQPLALVWQKY